MKIITIIGNKEVGKTTLFRWVIKHYSLNQKKKRFDPSPIINYTQDLIQIQDRNYKLIDTPNFIFSPKSEIEWGTKRQIEGLLKTSSLICWVIDKIDEKELLLKKYLRKIQIPQILIFNKVDLVNSEEDRFSYQTLWPRHYLTISALKGTNCDKLMEKIVALLPYSSKERDEEREEELKLLIFGPPNSGKSTLMNYLLKENRSLATPIAGTTQKPVISGWNWNKINFELVDTAGITKEQRLKEGVWRNCDLAWTVIDASLPLTKQILQIVNLGERHSKPLIIIINKCDLLSEGEELKKELKRRLKSLNYAPIIYISALKGMGIKSLLKVLKEMLDKSQKRFTKNELAELVEKMLNNNPPKYFKGNKLKIYFAKQEPGLIQIFVFFVNNPQWAHFSYQRYMTNYLRKSLGLEYLPIKMVLKKSE